MITLKQQKDMSLAVNIKQKTDWCERTIEIDSFVIFFLYSDNGYLLNIVSTDKLNQIVN